MSNFLSILALGGVLVLSACQVPSPSGTIASSQTPTPEATQPPTGEASPQPAMEIATTEQAGPTMTEQSSTQTDAIAALCVGALSKRLTLSPEQIRVLTVTPVTWQDASLGCPKPNIDYIRVETPGYLVILVVGEKRYECHTDMGRRVSFCGNK